MRNQLITKHVEFAFDNAKIKYSKIDTRTYSSENITLHFDEEGGVNVGSKYLSFYEFLASIRVNVIEKDEELCDAELTDYLTSRKIEYSKESGVYKFGYGLQMEFVAHRNWILNGSEEVSHFELFDLLECS